jgi:hypothetical protein
MGACYNTFLVPVVEREKVLLAVGDAVQLLGHRIVHREEPASYEDGFHYASVEMIFIGPAGGSRWVPLSSWGDGIRCGFPDWYRLNPLAMGLSQSLIPTLYLFSYNAGSVAGYSIFKDGQLAEANSLGSHQDWELGEFSPPGPPPRRPSLLAGLLGEPDFDFEALARGFEDLEVAIAALAARLGVSPHLIDPLDVQDGDGAIVVEEGTYKRVSLPGWMGVYYE